MVGELADVFAAQLWVVDFCYFEFAGFVGWSWLLLAIFVGFLIGWFGLFCCSCLFDLPLLVSFFLFIDKGRLVIIFCRRDHILFSLRLFLRLVKDVDIIVFDGLIDSGWKGPVEVFVRASGQASSGGFGGFSGQRGVDEFGLALILVEVVLCRVILWELLLVIVVQLWGVIFKVVGPFSIVVIVHCGISPINLVATKILQQVTIAQGEQQLLMIPLANNILLVHDGLHGLVLLVVNRTHFLGGTRIWQVRVPVRDEVVALFHHQHEDWQKDYQACGYYQLDQVPILWRGVGCL